MYVQVVMEYYSTPLRILYVIVLTVCDLTVTGCIAKAMPTSDITGYF